MMSEDAIREYRRDVENRIEDVEAPIVKHAIRLYDDERTITPEQRAAFKSNCELVKELRGKREALIRTIRNDPENFLSF
jgi:hypothetical protein